MSPVFGHGQLRLYLLTELADGPRHGYEIIRALEERFGGLYAPSAGTIYPRLARLEEDGLVSREDEGRKAVYRITPAGRAELAARGADVASLEVDLDRSIRSLAEQVRAQVRGSAKDLRAELAAAARRARRHARDTVGRPQSTGAAPQIDLAVEELRRASTTGTAQPLDGTTLTQVVRIIDRARDEIRSVVERAARG
jgi:DNA-binding PadR family transcriptional regulator